MIKHVGNTCPVDPNVYVRVQYKNHGQFISSGVYLPARLFNWAQSNAPTDIDYYEIKNELNQKI